MIDIQISRQLLSWLCRIFVSFCSSSSFHFLWSSTSWLIIFPRNSTFWHFLNHFLTAEMPVALTEALPLTLQISFLGRQIWISLSPMVDKLPKTPAFTGRFAKYLKIFTRPWTYAPPYYIINTDQLKWSRIVIKLSWIHAAHVLHGFLRLTGHRDDTLCFPHCYGTSGFPRECFIRHYFAYGLR